jgi:hypothetical protein
MYELLKNTNQRSSSRKIIDIPIFFGNQGDMLSGRTIDLSETGLSIVSDILFEVGTDVGTSKMNWKATQQVLSF